MKKTLKIFGFLIGCILLLLILAASYIQFAGLPTYEVYAGNLDVKVDSNSVAEGRRHAQMVCFQCHLNNNKLEGAFMMGDEDPFGNIWAPNITNHPEKGIGMYSNGELANLLRTGIKRDGTFAPPWMPKFPHLSDHDMHNLIAYLRSDMPEVQASEKVQPVSQLSFLSRALLHFVLKPLPYEGKPISAPPISDKVAYGYYLTTAKVECFGCHSPDFTSQNFLYPDKTPGFFSGGNPFLFEGQIIYSSNLTPDMRTGIGNWTEDDFVQFMKNGIKPDGTIIRLPMTPFPLLRKDEVSAIWAYLRTLPPVEQEVTARSEDSALPSK